jgi:hypothetical protein
MCAASSPLSTRSIVSATGVELLITFAPTASYDGRLWTSAADRTNVVCSLPTAAATAMANIGASLATSSEFFIKGQPTRSPNVRSQLAAATHQQRRAGECLAARATR